MKVITEKVTIEELKEMASKMFGNLVKAVVDVEKEILALDADLHSDIESMLLESGSLQKDIWGINIYPDLDGDQRIEFDSMINLRPSFGNSTRGVEDLEVQKKIIRIVNSKISN